MQISKLLPSNSIVCHSPVNSKKRALEELSKLLAVQINSPDSVLEIYNSLLARERMGSTAIGHGVALPRARLQENSTTIGAFITLDHGINFDSFTDNQPVDLIFALLVPIKSTQQDLQNLSSLANMFNDLELCEKLRNSDNEQKLYQHLEQWQSNKITKAQQQK